MGLCGVLVDSARLKFIWGCGRTRLFLLFFFFFWWKEFPVGLCGKLLCFPLACWVWSVKFWRISLLNFFEEIYRALWGGIFFLPHSLVADHLFRRIFRALWGDFIPPLACKKFVFRGFFSFLSKRFPRALWGGFVKKVFPLCLNQFWSTFSKNYMGLCGGGFSFPSTRL